MNQRDAKRLAWQAAHEILASNSDPECPGQPVDGSGDKEYARWLRAWNEVLAEVASRAGLEHAKP